MMPRPEPGRGRLMHGRATWPARAARGPSRASRSPGAARRRRGRASACRRRRPFGDRARERDVLVARRRIAARVVVHEHERARRLAQRDAQRVARGHVQPVDAARGHAPRRAQPVPPVEREHPELLVIERGEARARPRLDRRAVGQLRGTRRARPRTWPGARARSAAASARALGRAHARCLAPARRCPRARARPTPPCSSSSVAASTRDRHARAQPVPSTIATSSASPSHSTPTSAARSRGPVHVVSVVMTACLSKSRAAAGHRGSAGKPRGRACPGRFAGCPGTGGAGFTKGGLSRAREEALTPRMRNRTYA